MSDYLGRYYTLTPGWVNQRTLWWQNLLQPIMGTGADVQSTPTAMWSRLTPVWRVKASIHTDHLGHIN